MNTDQVSGHLSSNNQAFTLGWSGGELQYIEYTDTEGATWRRTLTWTSGELTELSAWVQQ